MPNIPKPDQELLDTLAAAGYPDPGPPKAEGLIDEAFPDVASDTASNTAAAASVAGPKAEGLIDEAFPDVASDIASNDVASDTASNTAAAASVAGPMVGAAVGAYTAMKGVADASQTKSSIAGYLIASGGAQQSDASPLNAMLSAFNRLAGFKSRM